MEKGKEIDFESIDKALEVLHDVFKEMLSHGECTIRTDDAGNIVIVTTK